MRSRTSPRWTEEGADPDYRFSLANERTFLAWVRTTLALLAAGVALAELVPPLRVAGATVFLGAVLAAIACFTSWFAYRRWQANERAMRLRVSLPFPVLLPLVASLLSLVSVLVLLLLVAQQA
ncbi:YidH family protein [Nocardioides sp. NPDC101246]|uniref:YidH family protein n=1 Tax=Nocardioides sp. NPDC101246 TaxID=3364336 RepID=UPI0037F78456